MIHHEAIRIATFAARAMIHVSTFLLISALISSFLKTYGFTKTIEYYVRRHERIAILAAALLGTTLPICSCGVIPIIAGLITSGVSLGPIMTFWLTSPIMDVTTFIMTWGILSPSMAIARLISAITIGCAAGFVTSRWMSNGNTMNNTTLLSSPKPCCAKGNQSSLSQMYLQLENQDACDSCSASLAVPFGINGKWIREFLRQYKIDELFIQIVKQVIFIGKWLLVAYIIEAMLVFYLPQDFLYSSFGRGGIFAIPLAALIGIPMYLNNLSGIPLVDGLMKIGMESGAALTFLIAGPITSIPPMIAVFKIAHKRIFIMYLLWGIVGSIVCGYLYSLYLSLV